MQEENLVAFILLSVVVFCPLCLCKDREYTVKVPAGQRSCFYHPIENLKEFELEFQVIEGGDLDVNVVIQSPSGGVIFSVQRKGDGIHKVKPSENGDHMLCFDNSFSRITNKLVFFAIIDDILSENEEDWNKFGNEEVDLDVKVEDIRAAVNNVKHNLERTVQLQSMLRVSEARDRSIMESNYERVNIWSILQVVVMITVSSIQLFLIKSLFDDRSRFNQFMRKASGKT